MSTASSGALAFQLNYQTSPIILTGGVASNIAGGALSLFGVSNAFSFVGGIASPLSTVGSPDDAFASFLPLPGSTLISQCIGEYPFANQTVAANAVIKQPLTISLLMVCPAGSDGNRPGYGTKPAVMAGIQATIQQHNTSGGLYSIVTPAFTYTDCVMLEITDVTGTESHQVQWRYRWDFRQPLVTLQAAATAYNALMGQIAGNLPSGGTQFGPANLAGTTAGAQAPGSIPSVGQGALTIFSALGL